MAKLGAPITTKFDIGTAELRLGLLSKANALVQADSIGVIDDATWTVNQTNVDLLAGFPRQTIDTAITEQTATVSATMREYSRRNLRISLGEGLAGTAPTAIATTLALTDVAAGATGLDVIDASAMAADDVLIIYPEGRPEDVSVLQISSIALNTLTFKTGQTTAVAYNAASETTTVFHAYVAHQVPIGALARTNYFSVMLIQQENSTGRPKVVSFWKGSIGGSLEVATTAEDYASNEMVIKCLQPAVSEYQPGGDLVHLADLIPSHPTGMLLNGAI